MYCLFLTGVKTLTSGCTLLKLRPKSSLKMAEKEALTSRGKNWSDEKTLELISLWSDDMVQEDLKDLETKMCMKGSARCWQRKGLIEVWFNVVRK